MAWSKEDTIKIMDTTSEIMELFDSVDKEQSEILEAIVMKSILYGRTSKGE